MCESESHEVVDIYQLRRETLTFLKACTVYTSTYYITHGAVGQWGSGAVGQWGSGAVGQWGSGAAGQCYKFTRAVSRSNIF